MMAADSFDSTATSTYYPCMGCQRKNCTMSSFYGDRCEFAIYHDYTFARGGYYECEEKPKLNKKRGERTYYKGYCAFMVKSYLERQINNNNKRIIQYKGFLTNITIQRRNITRD